MPNKAGPQAVNGSMKTLPFTNQDQLPAIGLGTWKSKPGEVRDAVYTAIEAGYRHIDCAPIYGNEKEVGEGISKAIADGHAKREELWVTSKLWNSAHRRNAVLPALQQTLADLGLEYLDLYLIHWPVAHKDGVVNPASGNDFLSLEQLPISETWEGMEEAAGQGLARHIGVSNFHLGRVQELVNGSRIPPEMNQVELHPFLPQQQLLEGCRKLGVHLTAYSPLGSGDRATGMKAADEPSLLSHTLVKEIAEMRGATPGQVLIQWAVQRGTAVIPKSVNPGRIRENLAAAQVGLQPEDVKLLDQIGQAYRFIDGTFWTREGSPYTLKDLWGE